MMKEMTMMIIIIISRVYRRTGRESPEEE